MYRYLFFDLDGTLTDSKEGLFNSIRYALEKLGGPCLDDTTLLKFIGPPLVDSYMEHCGFTMEQALEAEKAFQERYIPVGIYENTPVEGAAELFARLKEKGYRLAVASSKPETMCREICERFGFAPYLDVISGSPLLGNKVTKADVIRNAMAALGLTEKDRGGILMVGDRKFDVLGAAACGIGCLGVEFFGYAEEGELERAGAVGVVKTVEELEDYILNH